MRKIFLLFFTATVLFTFSCQNTTEVKKDEHAGHSMSSPATKTAGVFTADFKTNHAQIKAGETTELSFTIKNPNGETVKDVQIVHEKPLHLLIVSEDLSEFYHEHPEPQTDGSFKVPFTFKNGGNFKLYADFTPKDSKQVVTNYNVTVAGNDRAKVELKPDEKLEKTVDDLFVTMKPDGELSAKKELNLDFNVFDAKSKQPVTDLQNYLGELAHFVVISQDLKEFVHAHPVSDKKDGHTHDAKSEHTTHSDSKTKATVSAHLAFPTAGLYKIFAQFQRAGKIITVPFVVQIKAGETTSQNAKAVEIPADAYKITVSKDGFTPDELGFADGKFKRLAFHRTDAENCGNEVVIKELNVTKKLPVGEVVLVDLPANLKGKTLNFACGMNMYKGKIVVE
jgi:GTP:adenosylcobinamide-phosphate guanylyltransferase